MQEKHIYTMPEAFLADASVPARWRLLGLMNGFFINGLSFYASNAWVMERLGCNEQTVTNAVAELEALGEIRVERTRRSRVVHRVLKTPETLIEQPRDPNQLGSRDPNQLGTNSVIKCSKINSEKVFSPYFVVREQTEVQKVKKTADPDWPLFLKVRDALSRDAGFEVRTGAWDLKNLKRAREFLGSPQMVVGLIEDLMDNGTAHKLGYSISRMLSAPNLNRYKSENA